MQKANVASPHHFFRTPKVRSLSGTMEEKSRQKLMDDEQLFRTFTTQYDKLMPAIGKVKIVDTTARDGEQMPGVSFTIGEKVEIAKKLNAIGVEEMETFATYNDSDRQSAKMIADLGLDISLSKSDRQSKT